MKKSYFMFFVISFGLIQMCWPSEAKAAVCEGIRSKKAREACLLRAEKERSLSKVKRTAMVSKRVAVKSLRDVTAENIESENLNPVLEDPGIRRIAISALGRYAGSIVVMETQTGKILTMVNRQWAYQNGFNACSTVKMFTTLIGEQEKLINPDGTISGSKLTFKDALAHSNNDYFMRVGNAAGLNDLIRTSQKLGIGQKTGINAAGEIAGKLPYGSTDNKEPAYAYNYRITPLQLAVATSVIGNRGLKVTPQIPIAGQDFKPITSRVDIPAEEFDRLIQGMQEVTKTGTASKGLGDMNPSASQIDLAGKTGTCKSTATFTSFAPAANPKYTITVVLREPGFYGWKAASVASKIYEELFKTPEQTPKVEESKPSLQILQ